MSRPEFLLNSLALVLLGGFGNISGHVEIWDAVNRRRITKMEASNTTLLQWSPDGAHFVTATTSPRLRVDNGSVVNKQANTCIHSSFLQLTAFH